MCVEGKSILCHGSGGFRREERERGGVGGLGVKKEPPFAH